MNRETHAFSAEVGKILKLMIHSLYENRDIFLRELISNASDACDRLRYQAQTKPELLGSDTALKIRISADPKAQTLTVSDNGIGMTRAELIQNLGTVARSGTGVFMEKLKDKHDAQLIGQFGVGFYSSFMIADKVTVTSLAAGKKQAHIWESNGEGEFTIEESDRTERGTSIILHLKPESQEFLDRFRLSHIVKTYSDHIAFPIEFIGEDGKIELLNSASALWLKPKSEIVEAQYQAFYRHVAHAGDAPWMVLHNKAEGTVEYTNLLFIPSQRPFDLFHPDRTRRVKLYVRRVFITDQDIDIIPSYLRFLRGVVDSEDLPLNISRETLQRNAVLQKIRQSITSKILSELKKKAEDVPEEFATFWANFGSVLKEGLCDATEAKEKLLETCRFYTSESESLVSLDSYVSHMKEDQEHIYYLGGESREQLMNSPHLEGFKKRGIEVLLLTDPVDDFWVNVVSEFKGKTLQSASRSGIELEKNEVPKETSSDITKLVERITQVLGEQVKEVRVSHVLDASPACLVAAQNGMDLRMERFLYENKQLPQRAPKILEINPDHAFIKSLAQKPEAAETEDAIHLLFAQACIIEGETVPDAAAFSRRLTGLVQKALG